MENTNFIEIENTEEANRIDLNIYTFVTFSQKRDKYIFKKKKKTSN